MSPSTDTIQPWLSNNKCRLVLTFDEWDNKSFYFPHSSWNIGRNFLLYQLLLFEKIANVYIDYITFHDNDLLLVAGSLETDFEQYILKYRPAAAFPSYSILNYKQGVDPTLYNNFDANFNSFQRQTIRFVFPYEASKDNISWHNSQIVIWMYLYLYYRSSVIVTPLQIDNLEHRSYPRIDTI
eukprot:UN24077